MSEDTPDPKAIFFEALEQETPQDLADYLDRECRQDSELRGRVEELLRAHQKAGNFLGGTSKLDETVDLPRDPTTGTQIGPYKLLQRIGEGGMGEVYMAEQRTPVERRVAVKVIKPGMDSRHVIARFEAERQALAMMDHPNIARIFDAGAMEDGRPFFVMELVKGVPLLKYCDEHQLDVRKRLELFQAVCHAVQHAHHKGIIHRDLKPSNVLAAEYDDDVVPKIIDFGVAKATQRRLTDKTMFTEIGTVVGTIEYMSPEQAKLNQRDIDTRSDVYSLGVLLYELLIGEAPFDRGKLRSAALDEMLRIIREEEPYRPSLKLSHSQSLPSIAANRHVEPRKLSTLVRGDLDWIVMKSLEKDRNRRYSSPAELADDVKRFLKKEAVEARPPSVGYLVRKFIQRHKYAAATTIAIACALVIGFVGTSYWMVRFRIASHESHHQRTIAVAAMEEAKRESERRNRDLYFSEIALAYRLLEENNFRRVDEILRKYQSPSGVDYRGFEWAYLWKATESRRNAVEIRFPNIPGAVGFVPDGTAICVRSWSGAVTLHSLSENTDKATTVVEESIGRQRVLGYGEARGSFVGNWNGASSFVGYWKNGTVILQSLVDESEVELLGAHPDSVFAFDGDGGRVVYASEAQPARIVDTASGRVVTTLSNEAITDSTHPPNPLALSSDGRLLATVVRDIIAIWNVEDTRQVAELKMSGTVQRMRFSPDGSKFAAGSAHGSTRIKVWDTSNWAPLKEFGDHTDEVRALAFSPDGNWLASGSRDNTVKLWDTTSFDLVQTLRGHSGIVTDVAFSPDGRKLATSAQDYTVVIWDVEEVIRSKTNTISRGEHRVRFVGDLAVVRNEGRVLEIDPVSGEEISILASADQKIDAVAGNQQGEIAIAFGESVEIWKGGERKDVEPTASRVTALAFSPTGRRLAMGYSDGRVGCWDRERDSTRLSAERHSGNPHVVQFSPDGQQIASGGGWFGGTDDTDVILWNATSLHRDRSYPRHRDGIRSILFSPDGTHVISTGLDNDIRIWHRFDESAPERIFRAHTASVYRLLLDSARKRLVTAGGDRTVRIWDLDSGHQCGVINFSPDAFVMTELQWRDNSATLIGRDMHNGVHVWRGIQDMSPSR